MLARLSPTRLLAAHRDALALGPKAKLHPLDNLALTLLHAIGITALAFYFHAPTILAVTLLALMATLQFATATAVLAPLFFAYAVLAVRVIFVRVMPGTIGGYFDYEPPEWGWALLHVEAATAAAGIYATLIAASFLLRPRRVALLAGAILMVATMTWATAEYLGHRTDGTTGSDPYTYVQMGVDLATHGSAVHRFVLFPEFAPSKIAWYPLLHVGYHLPMNEQGDAVTVFPFGGSLSYAAAFRLFGEAAIYWVNPLYSLTAVMAAGLFAWELTRERSSAFQVLAAATTSAIVATANQQVVWAGVTMVDAQAEFFSLLCLLFALRTKHDKSLWPPLLSGASLGAAYLVRHTQLVLLASMIILFWASNDSIRGRTRALLVSGAAASVLAFGDLWYHQMNLGGWLHPESEELALFSLSAISNSASSLFTQAFTANEFGWLAPFLLYGIVQSARRRRVEFAALGAWLAASLALHLPYAALRMRDLLPEFPAVAFLTALGMCLLAADVLNNPRFRWAAGALVFLALELGLLRAWNTLPRAWQPAQPIFGYMSQSQRGAFDQLAALTPADAVIGSSLNDGAIELYSGRYTFRPDGWNSSERRVFLKAVRTNHTSIYLVEDGAAMDGVLDDLGRDSQIRRVGTLDVPLFGGPIAEPGALWKIEEK